MSKCEVRRCAKTLLELHESVTYPLSRFAGDHESCPPLLCTSAERIVLGIGRYVSCEADVNEFRLLPQSIDDLAYQVPPNAESCENLLVFHENVPGNEP